MYKTKNKEGGEREDKYKSHQRQFKLADCICKVLVKYADYWGIWFQQDGAFI